MGMVSVRSSAAVLDALADDLDGGYEAFVRLHATSVYSGALRLSGSRTDADDLTQETFVRAYNSLRRFDAARVRALEARAWLLTITVNLWRNRLRDGARRPRAVADHPRRDVPDPAPGPEAAAERGESARALACLLVQLPERERVPVVLRHVVGLSYAEIAATQSCPVGTAKANVSRGMARLRGLAAEAASAGTAGGRPSPTRRAPTPGRARRPQEAP